MAEIYYDVNQALPEVPINVVPLVDDTDFKSVELSISVSAPGMNLAFNFVNTSGDFIQTTVVPTSAGSYDWVNQGNGYYTVAIPASSGASINNDTPGYGWFTGTITGVLPFRGPVACFRDSVINEALVDSTTLITAADLGIVYDASISAVVSALSFNMAATLNVDDIFIGQTAVIDDANTTNFWVTYVNDVDQANDRIIIKTSAPFTVVAGDTVRIYRDTHPSYALNTYDPPTRSETQSDTGSILAKLLNYFQLTLRTDSAITTDNSADLAEINADEGSGSGSYDNTTGAPANVTSFNSVAIIGSGSADSLFRTSGT